MIQSGLGRSSLTRKFNCNGVLEIGPALQYMKDSYINLDILSIFLHLISKIYIATSWRPCNGVSMIWSDATKDKTSMKNPVQRHILHFQTIVFVAMGNIIEKNVLEIIFVVSFDQSNVFVLRKVSKLQILLESCLLASLKHQMSSYLFTVFEFYWLSDTVCTLNCC
jgi:hypothetical protein